MQRKMLLIIKDEMNQEFQFIKDVLQNHYDLALIHIKSTKQALQEYKELSQHVSTLIYDHDVKGGVGLLENIFHINPYQKTLIISNSPYCSDYKGCDNCKTYYNKKRIFYPKDAQTLLNE